MSSQTPSRVPSTTSTVRAAGTPPHPMLPKPQPPTDGTKCISHWHCDHPPTTASFSLRSLLHPQNFKPMCLPSVHWTDPMGGALRAVPSPRGGKGRRRHYNAGCRHQSPSPDSVFPDATPWPGCRMYVLGFEPLPLSGIQACHVALWAASSWLLHWSSLAGTGQLLLMPTTVRQLGFGFCTEVRAHWHTRKELGGGCMAPWPIHASSMNFMWWMEPHDTGHFWPWLDDRLRRPSPQVSCCRQVFAFCVGPAPLPPNPERTCRRPTACSPLRCPG